VRVAYFGPDDPAHATGGDLWLAASLAVEEINAAGGCRGLPLRLLPAWSENPWGTGISRLARMAYDDGVWAIIGSIDGASTHLAEQVVAKARLSLINPAGADSSVNLANVPWIFSCLPADDIQSAVLAEAITAGEGGEAITLVSATDHDSRHTAAELKRYLAQRGEALPHHLEFHPGSGDPDELAGSVAATRPRSVVILAGPVESARVLRAIRASLPGATFYGGSAMGRRAFIERAGPSREGVLFPHPCDPSTGTSSFATAFSDRFGAPPDCAAAQTYDAIHLTAAAINAAGLNRAQIRDALEALSPWKGVAGEIRWGSLGQNDRTVRMATIREGRVATWESSLSVRPSPAPSEDPPH
jgi:ABC-type branched-subunit amino acid transport system substrate-binding protein